MKKSILMIACVALGTTSFAQKQNIQSATNEYNEKDYVKAKEYIDKAIADPSTDKNPKAWFIRGNIIMAMMQDPNNKDATLYREAATSFIKADEYKLDYDKEILSVNMMACAFRYYNDGVNAYNEKKLKESAEYMGEVIKIHDIDGGTRYNVKNAPEQYKGTYGQFDTVAAESKLVKANCAYYSANYDEAISQFIEVKSNPITRKSSVYSSLIDAYDKKGKNAEMLATIDEARKAFPDDQTIHNAEINYYIKSGKQEDLLKKLEDAVAKDPNNAEFLYDLATTYDGMANPKDGKRPANAVDLVKKADDAYSRALKIAPDNAAYNYNYGAMFFNAAIDYNEQIANTQDQKKYEELKGKRDMLFNKALPNLEKAYTVLSANVSSLHGEDAVTYRSTLFALKQVYAVQGKMDKADDMKKQIDSFK